MKRVIKRTWLMALFIVILIGGMGLFLAEYTMKAAQWATAIGSPHLYNKGNIGFGVITDRSGAVLLDMNGSRAYSENEVTRESTMHWLGDRSGYVQAGAISHYVGAMSGFDPINGIYQYAGTGGTAELTISARVQNAAYAALSGRKGTVAVYNYKTGEILCAVTSPSYDPDHVPDISSDSSGKYDGVYLNRFLQSAYTPGSIFKIVTTAAALEVVPDILDRTFYCSGEYLYGQDAVTCESAHGTQDLKGAFAHSCNCCFAQIAELIGRKNMTKIVSQYQVTDPIRFDGVSTVSGNYDNSNTGGASFAWSCIGQHSDLINPCRYMTFMGTIAAGGKGVEPYLVSRVLCGEETTYTVEPRKTDRIMKEEIAKTLQEYMRNNVVNIYGAGNFQGLTVCGKSGTSQLGGGQRSNAMFSGFVLDEQYPLAFIAAVENGGYGAHTCIPILSVVLGECKAILDAE